MRLEEAVGARPIGFRGPGYSISPSVLVSLANRGYRYDASTLPSFLGPLARAYYFFTARLNPDQREQRKRLFGAWTEGLQPLRPYWWCCDGEPVAGKASGGRRIPGNSRYDDARVSYADSRELSVISLAVFPCCGLGLLALGDGGFAA